VGNAHPTFIFILSLDSGRYAMRQALCAMLFST
jgi:hypothetical protein